MVLHLNEESWEKLERIEALHERGESFSGIAQQIGATECAVTILWVTGQQIRAQLERLLRSSTAC